MSEFSINLTSRFFLRSIFLARLISKIILVWGYSESTNLHRLILRDCKMLKMFRVDVRVLFYLGWYQSTV